ncbi:MAG: hypothetical protein QOI98_3403, partial [Solirubrobacteraceae bacterium]|nr:hypothetical protein [Solirubrobacteraceae bacterium]
MKFATVVMVLLLSAGTAFANTPCTPVTNRNFLITWSILFGVCSSPDSGCAGKDLIFFLIEESGRTLDCGPYTVQWDFGDGTSATGERAAHLYEPGTHKVSARLTDAYESAVFTSTFNVRSSERRRVAVKASQPAFLNETTLRSVMLEYGSVEMQPGERRRLQLVKQECCVFFTPVIAVATFSIDPTSYATIDSDGVLAVNPSAPGGITLRV